MYVSQLDWAIVSEDAGKYIQHFSVGNDVELATSHAPLFLHLKLPRYVIPYVHARATYLVANLHDDTKSAITRKHVALERMIVDTFIDTLPNIEFLSNTSQDIDFVCETITDALYKSCISAVQRREKPPQLLENNAFKRWLNIINSNDIKAIWTAIN